jgi:predicted HTH domain antitoxin
MKTLTLNIPDSLDLNEQEVALLVASRMYEQGRLSLGQAAELAGVSKRTFAELLGRYGVSIFNYPASDLSGDVRNA